MRAPAPGAHRVDDSPQSLLSVLLLLFLQMKGESHPSVASFFALSPLSAGFSALFMKVQTDIALLVLLVRHFCLLCWA